MSDRLEAVGLSDARVARIDDFIRRAYLDTGKLHGVQLSIMRRGRLVHFSSLGLMDAERARPMADDAIFRIYSMTKPLTSVAFMMLVEEGLVALDDPVAAYIPAWSDLGVYESGGPGAFVTRKPDRPMLIIDLLRHTSGLTYGIQRRTPVDAAYSALAVGEPAAGASLETMVGQLAGLPLEFSPGQAWNYSLSTDVLGYLIQLISGRPFDAFLRERVLAPLAMVDTDFFVPAAKAGRFGACYALAEGGGVVLQDDPAASPFLSPPSLVSGGAGLVSTSADYQRFCAMLLGGGALDGERLVSPKTLALMGANHLPMGRDLAACASGLFSEAIYAGLGFGLGFSTTIDPTAAMIPGTVGDLSWGGYASTTFWVDPKEQLAVIFMTQLMPSSAYPIRRRLRTLVYSAFTESWA